MAPSTATSESSTTSSNKQDNMNTEAEKDNEDTTKATTTGNNSSSTNKKKRKRCGNCDACRREDCGTCVECVRKKKFGGTGESKQACINRRCTVLAELKRERKRRRAAGLPVEGDDDDDDDDEDMMTEDDDVSIQQQQQQQQDSKESSSTSKNKISNSNISKKRRRVNPKRDVSSNPSGSSGGENNNNNSASNEKDPIVLRLEKAYPNPPSTLLADEQLKKAAAAAQQQSDDETTTTATGQQQRRRRRTTRKNNLFDYRYGFPTPNPVVEVCAGCKSSNAPVHEDDPDREVVILLCDGPDCPHEYHLECCLPPISEIPDGNYYCIDCDPTGSAKVLNKYLDKHDERRHKELSPSGSGSGGSSGGGGGGSGSGSEKSSAAAASNTPNPFNFLFALWKEDLEENQDNWTDEKPKSDDSAAAYQRVPRSELSRLLEIQTHLQTHPLDEGDGATRWEAGKPYSLEDLGNFFIGKPIRLYCPLDDCYHSGRVVDYRPIPPNLHSLKKSSSSSKVNTTAKIYHPNDDFFANKIEFLVRFLPGSDEYRKTMVTRWIRLEEHSLAVGTNLVWGKFQSPTVVSTTTSDNNNNEKKGSDSGSGSGSGSVTVHPGSASVNAPVWTPSLLFLRTSRELMPVLHLLQESEGEITYHPPNLFPKSKQSKMSPNNPCSAPLSRMDPSQVWALAKRIGASNVPAADGSGSSEAYKLLRVIDETRDLWSRQPTANRVDQLKHSLVVAEHREQQSCQRWRKEMKIKNKFHSRALTARDEYGLGPVRFKNHPTTKEEEELCPLIRPPGLDRGHLMERLLKRGTIEEVTNDQAAGLECWLVP